MSGQTDQVCGAVASKVLNKACQLSERESHFDLYRWDEWLEFDDMFYPDLPRAAKLCVSICSVNKKRKNREEVTMLCWGNVGLFDWRSQLLADKLPLVMWPVPRGKKNQCHS